MVKPSSFPNERTNYESRRRGFSNPVRVSQIHRERGYILCRMVGDRHRITVIERRIVQTSLKILVENRINVRVG